MSHCALSSKKFPYAGSHNRRIPSFTYPNPVTAPLFGREHLSGLLLIAALGLAALIASRVFFAMVGVPLSSVLIALLAGLALIPAASKHPGWQSGIGLAAGPLLKLGVILVGFRLSLIDLFNIGTSALPLVLLIIMVTLTVTWGLTRAFGISGRLGSLLAVGTAICGTSAIAATAPALKARPEETAYAIACIALFGLAATLAYPPLFQSLFGDPQRVGLALGAAIHDTAQVTGAALLHEQGWQAGGTLAAATVTKLLRNLSMLAVIPLVVMLHFRVARTSAAVPFPWFVLGFVAAACLRTLGDGVLGPDQADWAGLLSSSRLASELLFAMAMAAIGMSLRPTALKRLGWRPAAVALLAALAAGVAATLWLLY